MSMTLTKKSFRPSTPIRRRCLASLSNNSIPTSRLEQFLTDLIDRLEQSNDSSTQLLIRLYRHKSSRLRENPDEYSQFQQEIFASLRRLHPTLINESSFKQENHLGFQIQPVVSCRSAQATIRKLH